MNDPRSFGKHIRIQQEVLSACQILGINAIPEYRGKDWRADIYVPNNGRPIAFEIQLSYQSLNKTRERQSKYIRDGIVGCWLFENPVPKLDEEIEELPLFFVEDTLTSHLMVNLGDRRKVDLHMFLQNFITDGIQFKQNAITKSMQGVNLVFYTMKCWRCNEINDLFYVDSPFYSACNAMIQPEEAFWASNSIEYRPEIIELAQHFVATRKDLDLRLGQIKVRYSKTVCQSYMSFGCYNCDSIFGDYFVMEAKIDVKYEEDKLTHRGEIELKERIELPIRHWCFPEDGQFCTTFNQHVNL